MVRLTRIYTRTGDDGSTGLGDGTRVPKTAPRIEAYGTVDELNACVGLAREQSVPGELRDRLLHVQQDLFDLGADLCVPFAPAEPGSGGSRAGGTVSAGRDRVAGIANARAVP
jgi:cob(I)alamin adenosyltransferase